MTQQEMESYLNRALDALFESDAHLLDANSSERSVTHLLAIHLMHEAPGFDVDCEYNRDGFDVKRLELSERVTTDENTEAVTVFPDIVIHQRGTNDRNLLVVEVKKASSNIPPDYDIQKLKAFRRELKYAFAVHVTVGKRAAGEDVRQVVWINS